jgi:hypothetical protein
VIRLKCFFPASLLLMLALCRCANPVSPEGGPKDTKPPKVILCDPPALTLNFKSKEIRITFNKFIQLKDEKTQVIISPPIKHTDIKLHGKTISIKINDSLKANTTYTINFGDAISDLTENNILHEYTYAFSTGSYIDSLGLSGRILNAFDLTTEKDVVAMLYVNDNDTLPIDSLPMHFKPYYLARAGESGEFTFRNLKDTPFLAFALKDMNSDNIFDLPNEKVAFCDSLVRGTYVKPVPADTAKYDTTASGDTIRRTKIKAAQLDSLKRKKDSIGFKQYITRGISLMLFQESDSVQKILKADVINENEVGIFYRFPIANPGFIPLNISDEPGWMVPEFNSRHDTVFLWLKKPLKDSLYLRLTNNGISMDTARIDLTKKIPKKKKSDKTNGLSPLKLSLNMESGMFNQFKTDPVILFSFPLSQMDLSRISLIDGKDTIKPKLTFSDTIKRRLRVSYKWKEDHSYKLIIPDSIFHTVNGNSNDSLVVVFKSHSLRDFGSLQLTITIKDPGNFIIQLLDDKETVVEQKIISFSAKVKFDYLKPGNYKLKAIYDRNHNNQWDTGNFHKKIQPERVGYFQKVIEVRANWDIDESWEL